MDLKNVTLSYAFWQNLGERHDNKASYIDDALENLRLYILYILSNTGILLI